MFFENLEYLCKENKTTASATAKYLGLSKGSVTSWKNGVVPNGDTIIKLSNHFGVTTDYLLLGTKNNDMLSSDEKNWLSLFEQLPEHDRIECIGFIKGYLLAKEGKK